METKQALREFVDKRYADADKAEAQGYHEIAKARRGEAERARKALCYGYVSETED